MNLPRIRTTMAAWCLALPLGCATGLVDDVVYRTSPYVCDGKRISLATESRAQHPLPQAPPGWGAARAPARAPLQPQASRSVARGLHGHELAQLAISSRDAPARAPQSGSRSWGAGEQVMQSRPEPVASVRAATQAVPVRTEANSRVCVNPLPPRQEVQQRTRLVNPDSSPSLHGVWCSYRAFDFAAVVQSVRFREGSVQDNSFTKAAALILAGAAAYLDGDSRAAREYFHRAATVDPTALPDPDIFPSKVISLFKGPKGVLP